MPYFARRRQRNITRFEVSRSGLFGVLYPGERITKGAAPRTRCGSLNDLEHLDACWCRRAEELQNLSSRIDVSEGLRPTAFALQFGRRMSDSCPLTRRLCRARSNRGGTATNSVNPVNTVSLATMSASIVHGWRSTMSSLPGGAWQKRDNLERRSAIEQMMAHLPISCRGFQRW